MRNRGRRWWSVYLADGTRLEDVRATARVIRATLPGAILDTVIGRVTITRSPIGIGGGSEVNPGAKVSPEVDVE